MDETETRVRLKEQQAKYYQAHKEEYFKRLKTWKKENPDLLKEQKRRYRIKNWETIKAKLAAYKRHRYATDPEYRERIKAQEAARRRRKKEKVTVGIK